MTKAEIADAIISATGVTKDNVVKVIDKFIETVKDSCINGNEVTLRGFGTFKTVRMPQRMARNISAGTTVTIPARNVVKFKPSKEFRDLVAGKQ